MTDLWPAPTAVEPVRGTIVVPGSKSETNRALILAALSRNAATITGGLVARDTTLMVDGLAALGIGMGTQGSAISVVPAKPRGPAQIDCGLAGTVMRFLPPLAALATGPITFDGDVQARRRPMDETLNALRQLGVDVAGSGLPFTLTGRGRVSGGEVLVNAAGSSQFVSGLLLSGARYDDGLLVRHRGDPVPSLPHIMMTVEMLRGAGAQVESDARDPTDCWWQVAPTQIDLGDYRVEPDLSNAAAFLAAAMITGGRVTIAGWPESSTQPGERIRTIFATMGATVTRDSEGLTLTGPATVHGVDIDLHEVGELTPTIAAVCLFGDGTSRLRGIGHLRGHETDRIAALASQIEKLGAGARSDADSLTITPARLTGADLDSFADHRMATFAAIVGLRVPGVRVHDVAATTKTMPNFVGQWQTLVDGATQ